MDERVLSGRYRLVGHLARGGMADVYEAEDVLLNRRVAVKILHRNFAADEAFVTRFRREAQAAANLNHPNIVAIYDWGRDTDTYYMVMELIEGRTLREILRSEGALLPRRAAEIAAEAAAALTVAHQAGVFHRDVKPGNIMITRDGAVKVTDFGIARALDDSEELTRTGAVIGTATYFSPEQAQGLPADERSDVYSLGIVLYEMLAGRPPFTGESPVAVAYQHVSEHAPLADEVNPEVPAELAAIARRAMAKDPAERYQTADEMRSDLLLYLGGNRPVAAAAAVAAAPTALVTAPPATAPPDEAARAVAYVPDNPAGRGTYYAAVAGLLAALAVGIFVLSRLLSGGATAAAAEVTVPDLRNQPRDQAFDALQALDLKVRTRSEPSETVPEGLVIDTDPPPGADVPSGSYVTVIVSLGVERFAVPAVVGDTEQVARSRMEAQGFVVGPVTYRFAEGTEEGIVIEQDPLPGIEAEPGTMISLVVSKGPESLTVPNVAGIAQETAILQLSREGFENVEVREEFSEDVETGFVIRTEPGAGQVVPRSATVAVVVSKGPAPVAIPDLTGMTPSDAEATLRASGLTMVVGDPVEVALDTGLVGLVAEQDPAAGGTLPAGSEVTVRLGKPRQVVVPDLIGLTDAEASDAGAAAGVIVEIVGTVGTTDSALVGKVVSQDPAAGGAVDEGTGVSILIGVPVVPDIIGLTEEDARAAVEAYGLTLEVVGTGETTDTALVGKVVSQDPAAGAEVAPGTAVTVTLGVAPSTTTTTSQ